VPLDQRLEGIDDPHGKQPAQTPASSIKDCLDELKQESLNYQKARDAIGRKLAQTIRVRYGGAVQAAYDDGTLLLRLFGPQYTSVIRTLEQSAHVRPVKGNITANTDPLDIRAQDERTLEYRYDIYSRTFCEDDCHPPAYITEVLTEIIENACGIIPVTP
jgi:hypothetical protein